MANINDYLFWRGDLKFSERKFNELDALVLARFSYLPFHKISLCSGGNLGEICENLANLSDDEFLWEGDKTLALNLAQSARFGDLRVSDIERDNDKEAIRQFGALCIHLDVEEIFVSFIGTDNSILGWQEDFNMAFLKELPCQISGLKYLEKIAQKYPHARLKIGGHSKGGNVAIYSALLANPSVHGRIIKVYNYDGPGFLPEFYEQNLSGEILSKIQTYIPNESIIGNLLSHKESIKIVQSSAKLVFAHDIFSWEVGGEDFIYAENLSNSSKIIDKTLSDFMQNTTTTQRKIAIEAVFELFNATSLDTFAQIPHNLPLAVPQILQKYKTVAKDDKKMIANMLLQIASAYLENLAKHTNDKIKDKRQSYKDKFKEKWQI
ncbi:DUF2974 domain-containing protein [Campylobacter sp. JMF_02 ED1]|uniref:Mbeg1-like protein n=1 Tax=unclassified Campylobacter TaxID=2593542 RepID=UPI0022EA06DE|nr:MULTISPECIES: Mbeg1-like protein [unclassified Campylobacter]MDA3049911.1 DUF2974 domain-containing protein [Campylobacter sp. JMF_15 NE4]MDA3050869.1 DUF2974 domain-containing protein [Campylobacter sp. JMF_02 ED1]